ncbi:hypothetical protein [Ferrimonas lipolytica]|uniref:Surface antigen n=1 Tax=Ferrimonas lipolytica TaxID=2724191 RepID=A0A6H1UDX2_9GAMM|nr:hypothetical protein [Ferrimonas lipolytica]QIZ77307.1 hypothetical protein HER31_10710 [Ferrimonas lipolytica]
MKRLWLATAFWATAVIAEPHSSDFACADIEYKLERNSVFDPNDKSFTWLHRFANQVHFQTKELTIENELDGFELCQPSDDALYEVERHLRNKRYFRDAKVSGHQDNKVLVETWDTWSLLPVLEFSRAGGENELAAGIKDSNLLGYGVNAELLYYDDYWRSGYELRLRTPLYMWPKHYGSIAIEDADDGERLAMSVNKPFFGVSSDEAMWAGFNFETRVDTIEQNDTDVNEFSHDIDQYQGWYGFAPSLWRHKSLRYHIGYFYEQHQYQPVSSLSTVIPSNRTLSVPWGGVRYQQDQYERMQNIFLINTTEDVNLGWTAELKLGWNTEGGQQGEFIEASASKGSQIQPDLLWLSDLFFVTQPNAEQQSFYSSWKNELFWSVTDSWRLYGKWLTKFSDNQPLEQPVTVGGFTDLRGYPNRYQHGKRSNLVTTELRYYPNINLWQLAELGATVFYDAARATGGSPYSNNPKGILQSVGVGVRLYISHGGRNVLHFDVAHPISDNDNVDSWEWRAEARTYF